MPIGTLHGGCRKHNFIPIHDDMLKPMLTRNDRKLLEPFKQQNVIRVPQFTAITETFINDAINHLYKNSVNKANDRQNCLEFVKVNDNGKVIENSVIQF